MADTKGIELNFTIADGVKNTIVDEFSWVKSEIEKKYGELDFKISPQSIASLEKVANILKNNKGFKSAYDEECAAINRTITAMKNKGQATQELLQAQKALKEAQRQARKDGSEQSVNALNAAMKKAQDAADKTAAKYREFYDVVKQVQQLEISAAKTGVASSKSTYTAEMDALKASAQSLGKELGMTSAQIEEAMKRTTDSMTKMVSGYESRLKTAQKSVNSATNAMSGVTKETEGYEAATAALQQYTAAKEHYNAVAASGSRDMAQMEAAVTEVERTAEAYHEAASAAAKMHAEQVKGAHTVDDQTKLNRVLLQMQSYAEKYGANLSKNIDLQSRFNALINDVQAGKLTPAAATKAFAQLQVDCRAAGVEVETLGQKLNKLFGEGFKQRFKTIISMAAVTALRQVWQNVKDIDEAMTELKKVTDETDKAYQRFMTNAADRAQALGATMSDVVQATAEFARLGYEISDASQLADTAIVLKNVGDGITDITDASQKIISVVKAFPEFEDNAMAVVDKMNEVGRDYCPAA